MNLQNFRIEKEPAPSTDWRVFGDIEDDNGNILGTFGQDGTSVNVWWVTRDCDSLSFAYRVSKRSCKCSTIHTGSDIQSVTGCNTCCTNCFGYCLPRLICCRASASVRIAAVSPDVISSHYSAVP